MAIDEQDVFAGVADDPDTSEPLAGAPAAESRPEVSLDDLRHRLDTPLYAREPGLAAAAQVPGLRELTWDHVTNPTTSHPVVVPGESIFEGETGGGPRPSPLNLDDLLSRPQVTLKPIEPLSAPMATPASLPAVETNVESAVELPAESDFEPTPVPAAAARSITADAPVVNGRSSLPSFADIVNSSGPVDATRTDTTRPDGVARADAAGVDSLVKPIDEPPPVARDTDPLVSGLAELIMQSTPGAGMPSVAELREVSRNDTGMVPVVAPPVAEPPVLDAKVEFAAVSTAVPVIPPPPPSLTPPSGMPAPTAAAEVEAEMNRLAFLPDQDDVGGPVEVPEIAYSDVRGADPVAAPTPSLRSGEMYQPRPSASPVRHNYTDLIGGVTTNTPSARRRKRHHIRNFVTLVVLLGMVAGGLFAVKRFVLDRVQWSAELAPLAKDVETTRELTFEKSVTVETLPPSEFAVRIVSSVAGYPDATRSLDQSELRALGLLGFTFDAADIGLAAMADSPAFYDPTDGKIYVVDQLAPELRTFALHRALTMALLDQHFDWGARLEGASPAVRRGTRALYDGDALAVAQTLLDTATGDELRTTLNKELFTMYSQYSIPLSPSPFVSVSAGRFGLALEPYLRGLSNDDRTLLETDAAVTDGQALDLRRLVGGAPEDLKATSRGMLFWYHALAGRVDDDLAWKVALAWQNDELTATPKDGGVCVAATVQFATAGKDLATAAFNAWAAAAPKASATTVAIKAPANGPVEVTVNACDPSEIATNDGKFSLSLGGAPLRAEQFADLMSKEPTPSDSLAACAVYNADVVTVADERAMIDPVDGWTAPANHKVDLKAAACANTTP